MAENGLPQSDNRSDGMNKSNEMNGGSPNGKTEGTIDFNSNTGMSINDYNNQAAENKNLYGMVPTVSESGASAESEMSNIENIPYLPAEAEGEKIAGSTTRSADGIPELPTVLREEMPLNSGMGTIENIQKPIASKNEKSVDLGNEAMDIPGIPLVSEGGKPVWHGVPSIPINPPSQYYGQVRFLNASTNSFPVNISVDNNTYAVNSHFGTISNYDWISDGFHTITVRRATGLRTILQQQTFPFTAGQKTTMVLVDSSSGGLNLVRIADTGCVNIPYNSGCYRIANMSYSGSEFDLMMYGDTIFRNVGFQEVMPYKQAMAGSYQFYLTRGSNFTVIRELPVIIIGAFHNSGMVQGPLVSFQVDILAGRNYTSYIIGNSWTDYSLRVMTVED